MHQAEKVPGEVGGVGGRVDEWIFAAVWGEVGNAVAAQLSACYCVKQAGMAQLGEKGGGGGGSRAGAGNAGGLCGIRRSGISTTFLQNGGFCRVGQVQQQVQQWLATTETCQD